jgi:hypothetical protein
MEELLTTNAMKIPDDWNDPNSLAFNIAQLIFWGIATGVMLFLLAKFA